MDRLRRLFVLCAVAALALSAAEWPVAARTQIRPFYVSVTDSKGEPKAGVTAADLLVEVNGKAAAVTKVEPAAEPVSVVVITEGLGREFISEVRRMMKSVVTGAAAIHPDSRVGLMTQDGAAVPPMHTATTDVAKLDAEIARVFESSRNAPLLDSIITAAVTLSSERNARRAIIAVTWGGEAQSDVRSVSRVAQAVRGSGASLWVLDLGGREASMEASELRVLADVTANSGGRRERTTVQSITPLSQRILATLRGQYAIYLEDGITPKAASPKVSARTKDLKVLAPAWPAIK